MQASCKKENKWKLSDVIAISVVEDKTNLPVSGASVNLYTRAPGCETQTNLYASFIDENGICQVLTHYFNDPEVKLKVSKSKYWNGASIKVLA